MKKLAIILTLLLTACENRWWQGKVDYNPMPHQGEATTLIWDFYNATSTYPPTVGWIDYSDCFYEVPSFIDGQGECVTGDTYVGDWLILLEQSRDLAHSALPHELAHGASYVLNGNADANHTGSFFQPNGPVVQAYQMLSDRGW